MKIKRNKLSNLFSLLLCFVHLTSSSVVRDLEQVVRNIYHKKQSVAFSTKNGSQKSIRPSQPVQSAVHSLVHDPRSGHVNPHIPAKFIRRAQLLPGNSVFPVNSRYWSHSTAINSNGQSHHNHLNKVSIDNEEETSPLISYTDYSMNDDNDDDGKGHSMALADQEYEESNNDLYNYAYSPTKETINGKKYKVVISAQMDSPFSNDEAEPVRSYQTTWSKQAHMFDKTENYIHYTTERKTTVEAAHQAYRSPVRWAHRDLRSSGQANHRACNQLLDRGVGPDEVSSWYYDTSEGICRWFGYRGYGGNANRFYSRTSCEALCIYDSRNLCESVRCLWPQTTCALVGDESCKDYKRLREKSWEAECPPDQPVCLSRRKTRMAPDIDFQGIPAECRQDSDAGSCYIKNPSINFFYDVSRNDCMAFYFHECGGNDNRFQTKSECMTHCSP